MPFTRPSILPEYATLDVYDGLLGAINVQTPPTEFKEAGWHYGQTPPREYFNWLHRYTYLNLGWLVQEMDAVKVSKSAQDADNYFRSQW